VAYSQFTAAINTEKFFTSAQTQAPKAREVPQKDETFERKQSHTSSSWSTATNSGLAVSLLQPPASSESVNEKNTHEWIIKNCPSEAPEGDSYKALSTLCNAGGPRRMVAFLIAAFPGR